MLLSYPMAVADYVRGDTSPELGQSPRSLNRNPEMGVPGTEPVCSFTLKSLARAPG